MAKDVSKTFSQSLQSLETIVSELKAGNLPLERALERFEAGVKLVQTCQSYLTETKGKVEVLVKTLGQDDEIETEDFETEADNDEEDDDDE